MSRSVLSTAQVPQVHDESVATTLKVIMDVLKVRFYKCDMSVENYFILCCSLDIHMLHANYQCLSKP